MNSWRDQILNEFTPNVATLTLVADPDGLLLEEGVLAGIRERGFVLIPFEDHVAFRYAYESMFRSQWDKGKSTDSVIVLRSQSSDLNGLPYDLLRGGRKLSFNLGDMFPNLSYPVIAALDHSYIDALYEAQSTYTPRQLSENDTKGFILRHVFEIAPELVKQPSDLLRVLLRCHYKGLRIPEMLSDWFIDQMWQSGRFDQWPLKVLVTDREAFFAFLQERWPIFLDREANKSMPGTREVEESYDLTIDGPVNLPFDHHDVRVYIDNLFTEGWLHPVKHTHAGILARTWVRFGLATNPIEDKQHRMVKLMESLQISVPTEDASHSAWFQFAHSWAELIVLINEQLNGGAVDLVRRYKQLQSSVDVCFAKWMRKRYASLVNLPPLPVMLHHLPRFLARQVDEEKKAKLALIVVDGMAMDQWLVVREALAAKQYGYRFRDQAVFAWVPTLTSVSRQAIFAGRVPIYFPDSISTTDREQALWSQFWVDQGFTDNQIKYMRGLGDGALESVAEALAHPQVRVVGLVVDIVDRIMHGMELGTAGMHDQVRHWASGAYFHRLLSILFDCGFRVYLTSDHGNIEAVGCGSPAEGVVADIRGERVRVYPDLDFRCRALDRFPDAMEWDAIGLPDNYYPLLAPHRRAFVNPKKRTVSHGGVSVEEVIVPFVQIERISK
ncbi:MAG: BREX-3 system phosphatase PglZ [Limnochordia bacterium]